MSNVIKKYCEFTHRTTIQNNFMLLLLITSLFGIFFVHCIAQKFRDDYVWSSEFEAFYRLHDYGTTWHKARHICEIEGGLLYVPYLLNETARIKVLLSNMKPQHYGIFVGIHSQFSPEDFVTLKGERCSRNFAGITLNGMAADNKVIHVLWDDEEPNLNSDSSCVILNRESLLEDRSCDELHSFLCTVRASKTFFNEACRTSGKSYKAVQEFNKCYKLHTEPLSWHDAYLTCKRESGQLVVVSSDNEASYVIKSFDEIPQSPELPNPDILFVGFSDLIYPNRYRTVTGKTLPKAGYAVWDGAQREKLADSMKRCGAITRTGTLVAVQCNSLAMFLCETSYNTLGRKSNLTETKLKRKVKI